jgi:hypothetical protein
VSENAVLELERWGTLFTDRATEKAYAAWQVETSVPFNRLGLYLSIALWAAGIPMMFVAHKPHAMGVLATVALVVMPLILAALVASYRPPLRRAMQALVALANASAGLVVVGFVSSLVGEDPKHNVDEWAMGAALLVNYFGFVIFRLRPLTATLAVAPYMLTELAWYAAHVRAGIGAERDTSFGFLLIVSGFLTGLTANVIFDVTSRRAFRQERIIEAQKARIEQAEAALQRELSHQVAQRSRELGAALAQKDVPSAAMQVAPGTRFDARYEIVRALGQGGMGAVYEVRRLTDGQSLALKVVTGAISRTSAQRFAREAEIGARLRHANLVPIVDVGVSPQGAPFLVMELVKGASLEERRERFGDTTWAMPILRQIACGLAALHGADVVHRDLKPANVLLSGEESSLLARIADFGISRIDEAADGSAPTAAKLTATNGMIGTPVYMAPELAAGRAADAAADIFAFGIVAYELLSGRPPFAMPPVILAMAGQAIPPPPGIAPEIVLRCLLADPKARPCAEDLSAAFA